MTGQLIGQLVMWFIIAVIAIVIIYWALNWLYRRSTKETAFVRTGFLGEKVVIDGGAFVWPIVHDITPVKMNTLQLEVERSNENALITKDRMRVDVVADFYVRVRQDREAVSIAASTLGRRTMQQEQLHDLLFGKFVSSLRSVAAEMTLEEIHEQRADYVTRVKETALEALAENGLELESVAITDIDQTSLEHFNPSNRFDAEGLTRLIEEIETKRRQRNDIEQETAILIRSRNLEAEKQSLQIELESETARLQQTQEIETRRADQRALIAQETAQKDTQAQNAKISSQEQIEKTQIAHEQAVSEARIRKELDIRKQEIEKQRELESSEISSREAIDLNRIKQEQAIAEAEIAKEAQVASERIAAEKATRQLEIDRRKKEDEAEIKAQEAVEAARISQQKALDTQRIEAARETREQEIARDEALEAAELSKQRQLDTQRIGVELSLEQEQIEAARKREVLDVARGQALDTAQLERRQTLEQLEVQRVRALREAEIMSREEVERARLATERGLDEARISVERDRRALEIERDHAVETAQLEKAISIYQKSLEESAAQIDADLARAKAAEAEEAVRTARAKEEAHRRRTVELSLAEKDAEAKKIAADADKVRAAVEAEAQRLIYEAENILTDESRHSLFRRKMLEHVEGIIAASVKPMEKINDIKIMQLDGIGGGNGGVHKNTTDEVIDSALRYRVQAPMVDNLLSDIGIEGGSLSKMGGLIREARDLGSIAKEADRGKGDGKTPDGKK